WRVVLGEMRVGADHRDSFELRWRHQHIGASHRVVAKDCGERVPCRQVLDSFGTEEALAKRALWIGIDDENVEAERSEVAGEVKAARTLSASAFLIDETDRVGLHPNLCLPFAFKLIRGGNCHWQFGARSRNPFANGGMKPRRSSSIR